jgi:hypothetical protein
VTRSSQERTPPEGERPPRARHVLLALPIGLLAAVLLWLGDQHLTQRDWTTGAVVFGLGLLCTGVAVNQLRRAGLLR